MNEFGRSGSTRGARWLAWPGARFALRTTLAMRTTRAMRTTLAMFAMFAAALLAVGGAHAQGADWPQRPIRLVVAAGAGGGPDVLARLLAPRLGERLGQPVVVENRVGAGGDIGMEAAARAAPDGYTVLLAQTALVVNPALRKTPFDPVRDFVPVAGLVQSDVWLVASPRHAGRGLAQIIEHARAGSGVLTCGNAGGLLQLGCELLRVRAPVRIDMLLYKGTPQVLQDLAIGDVDLAFVVASAAAGQVQAGLVRLVGTSSERASGAGAARIAPIAEQFPGFSLLSWQGLVAPAGTPAEVVARLHRAAADVLAEPDTRRRLADLGFEVNGSGPVEFGRLIARDADRFARIVRRD